MLGRLNLNFDELIGSKTILYGDTNTRKTLYTSKFIQYLIESKNIQQKEISILDFAPPSLKIKDLKIGGKIEDFYEHSVNCNNIYFKGDIIPPRLKARNKKEFYENACKNYKKTSKILKKFIENPTSILIINDISIYLHIGNKNLLLDAIKKPTTFFGNAYYGSSIQSNFPSLFSLREKRLIEYIIKRMDYSFFTG